MEDALPDPIHGYVVVAGNDQGRHLAGMDAIDEAPGCEELRWLGALGEISRDHHQVGALAVDQLEQPLRDPREVGRSEVDVGAVDEDRHGRGRPPLLSRGGHEWPARRVACEPTERAIQVSSSWPSRELTFFATSAAAKVETALTIAGPCARPTRKPPSATTARVGTG